jgi:hypothetical protein
MDTTGSPRPNVCGEEDPIQLDSGAMLSEVSRDDLIRLLDEERSQV